MQTRASAPIILIHGLVVLVVQGKADALRSARRRMDEALSRQAALVASLPDTVARIDREGRFLWVSPGSERLVLPPEHLVGRLVTEFIPAEAADEMRTKRA